ncbi:hypothetical protein HELRODRAFT_179181 [Helobdella robusta]|uniref:Uncharacterized protein n=1 Tax=Helobdella robusta TaxID=6412 RepID=T1FEB3_HELRO|nr:hypothetical protein HELRODRAFT_179181 [Helobdella robusta]ESN95706.1 hypothetical protein HELRODRAFT_179181 [Helobdella robusta]
MAVKNELGSAWLRALPITPCGTRLDDSCVHVSLGLRLGAQIVTEYECACGARVDELGYHSLSCRLGPGKQARHTAVNEYLVQCFQKTGIPVIKEPMGLIEERAFRPDGYTITLWAQGRYLFAHHG